MSMWTILGIGPTKDIAVIKTAYAHKAKEWHPEEHPEEFLRLREAYRMAMQYAKSNNYVADAWNEMGKGEAEPMAKPEPDIIPESQPIPVPRLTSDIIPESHTIPIAQPTSESIPVFDYEQVKQKAGQEYFLRQFEWVAWNPYLINLTDVWNCLLGKVQWQEFLGRPEAGKLLEERIMQLDGFKANTLFFLRKIITKHGGKVNFFKWKVLELKSLFGSLLVYKRIKTNEDKKMHSTLLEQLRKRRIPYDLKYPSAIEAYLTLYMTYAESAETELKRRYEERRSWRNTKTLFEMFLEPAEKKLKGHYKALRNGRKKRILLGLFLACWILLICSIWGFEDGKTEEEFLQERRQEIAKYQTEVIVGDDSISTDLEENICKVLEVWENGEKGEKGVLLENGLQFVIDKMEDDSGNRLIRLELWRPNENEGGMLREEMIFISVMRDIGTYVRFIQDSEVKLNPLILKSGVHYYLEKENGGQPLGSLIVEEDVNAWISEKILLQK